MFGSLLAVFSPFATRGFDYHHHGLVLATLRRILNGEVLYRDVWSQYGPLPTYLQALVSKVIGFELVNLQYLTCIVLASSGAIMFKVWEEAFSRLSATVAVCFWAGTSYFFDSKYSMLPWSSEFALLFLCLAIYLPRARALSSVESLGKRVFRGLSIRFLLSGVCLGLSFWCRLNTGITAVTFFVLLLFLLRKFAFGASVVIGFVGCVVLGLILLGSVGAADEFIEQTILWPGRWSREIWGATPVEMISYGLIFVAIPSILLFVVLHAILSYKGLARTIRVVVGFVFFLTLRALRSNQQTNDFYWNSETDRYAILGITSTHLLWATMVLSVGAFSLWLGGSQKLRSQVQTSLLFDWPTFVRFAPIGLLSGIYPSADRSHIWLVLLPTLGGVVEVVLTIFDNKSRRNAFLAVGLAVLASSFLVEVKDNVQRRDLQRWNEGTLWDGMLERADSREIRLNQVNVIKNLQDEFGPSPVLTICQDPMYSTLGENSFPDGYTIYWGPVGDLGFLPADALSDSRKLWVQVHKPILFVCRPALVGDAELDLNRIGYKIYKAWPEKYVGEWGWNHGGEVLVPRDWLEG